jgi:serine protease
MLSRRLLVAVLALAGVLPAGCGADPPSAVTVRAERAPLGVAGKPLSESPTGEVIADELLVRFAPLADDVETRALVARLGGEMTWRGRATGWTVVRFDHADDATRAAAALVGDPRVAEVARNHVMRGSDAGGAGIGTSPSAPLANLQWNLWGMGLDPMGPRAPATGVVVAVLDTGVAYEDHADATGTYARAPDLAGTAFAPGWDFVNDDAHPNDDQRHGTHVAGVIAAAGGIASVAPGATILPVKVLDGENAGTELALAEGIRYAVDHGARVINMSLSFPPTYFPSRVLQEAVDYAAQHGVVMVAAVGNHGEDIVAYPAAFRDVIAVGASDVPDWYHVFGKSKSLWKNVAAFLWRAGYSNRSFKVDVVAPAGSIAGDANFDGQPEAVLAQTFAPGDPTSFGYYFYAGTSQAAAEVSALAAVLVAKNPELGPHEVRALLVENARQLLPGVILPDVGRGAVRYPQTVNAATTPQATAARERFLAGVTVTLHDVAGGATVARAVVEVTDVDGRPQKNVVVYGMFTGAAFGARVGMTDASGRARFESDPLAGNMVVAFQVDAVTRGGGAGASFDRPRGFVRIDSTSLVRLAAFASQLAAADGAAVDGIGTSPSGGPGLASGGVGGAGIGTSPSGPEYELPTDPALTPITVAFDPALYAGTGYRATLMLPSFSWGLATVPMAVAVDEAWFLATFPGAAARRVVSYGSGVGGSPLRFEAGSFPVAVTVDTSAETASLPLLLVTFGSGVGTSPSGVAGGTGIGTSPSAPVLVDPGALLPAPAQEAVETLVVAWFASGAGIGTSPSVVDPEWAPLGEGLFDHVSGVAQAYAEFGASPLSTPAAAYGAALGAAAMPMAPVPPDADGEGLGISALP